MALCVLFYGCSNSSNESIEDIIRDQGQTYIQSHYQDFSKGAFQENTSVKDDGNRIYEINGKMLDDGGWEHQVSEKIQISPNGKEYIVCYLWIDGQSYVINQPRSAPSTSSDGSSQEALKEAENLNGQTVEMQSSSPDSRLSSEEQKEIEGRFSGSTTNSETGGSPSSN